VAHVSLYRKYRSQTFAEVVGQDHVTRTLSGAIAGDKLHHAYLFTGPRGTGKTSTARILAKAVNCVKGPTPEPCNACEHCVAITTGSSVDVIEIDAASHGGVDDVRELRDRVAFAPASARMKVYIVDECHMLSTAGWNAFLKTVEEPPGHVLFVFATTEPHKVPPTILSRTQRFDLKRIPAGKLADHVRRLAELEGLQVEPGAVAAIVRAGDGSARDTLSVLDQVVAYTGKEVTLAGVVDVLGSVADELLGETAGLIAAGDVPGLCALVGRLSDAGHDLRQFTRDAVEHLRRLFLLRTAPSAGLVEGTAEQLATWQDQAERLGQVELLRAIEFLVAAQAEMRRGHVRLPVEIALVKAAMPEAYGDPGAVAARLDRLERRIGAPDELAARPASAPAADVEVEAERPEPEADPAPEAEQPEPGAEQPEPEPEPRAAPARAGSLDLGAVEAAWPAVLEGVKAASRRLHAFLAPGHPTALDGDTLEVTFAESSRFHAEQCGSEAWLATFETVFEQALGARLRLRCVVGGDARREPAAPGTDEVADVLDAEAAERAGELPGEDEAHDLAVETLTRELGAQVVDDNR
jgi:DNA polymerase-3 subunit gamma/tau